jgi:hypothetical protein
MPQIAPLSDVQAKTQGFGNGVNIQDAPNELSPTEVRRAENGILDERGGFTKRLGCQSQGVIPGAAGDRILSTYIFYRGSVAPQFLIHTSAGRVFYTADPNTAPVVWVEISAGGWSTTQPMSWETFNSKCYFCDGFHAYASWDGAAYATYASAPIAKYLRLWKDTMFVSGVVNLPDRVYSSAPGDAETWPVVNWVDIRRGDGDAIRALGTDGLFLIIGKRNSGIVITDPALLVNHVFDYEKGIESHWSIIEHESGIFYITRRGVAQWQGDAPASLISYKIDPLFDPRVLNFDRLEFTWAYAQGQRISWCLAELGSAVATMQVNYYPRLAELTALGIRGLGPWSFDRIPMACAALWRYQSTQRLFGGSTIANKFYWVFADTTGQDDGATFHATLETGTYDFGQPLFTKYLRRLRILGRGQFNIQLRKDFASGIYKNYAVDLTSGPSKWNVGTWNDGSDWGPDSNVKETTINPDAYGRYMAFIFTDADPDVGSIVLPIGSKDLTIPSGQWSILGCLIDGFLLGIRES